MRFINVSVVVVFILISLSCLRPKSPKERNQSSTMKDDTAHVESLWESVAQRVAIVIDKVALDSSVVARRDDVKLSSAVEYLDLTLRRVKAMSASAEDFEVLNFLKQAEFFEKTGIKAAYRADLTFTISEIETLKSHYAAGNIKKVYDALYMEEIDTLAEVPRYDAKNLRLEIPGEVRVVDQSGKIVPILDAVGSGLVQQEFGRFIIGLENLTRIEEVFHAADHATFSQKGISASPSFNRFLEGIGRTYDYSSMTEMAFGFYLEYDAGATTYKTNDKVRASVLNAYPQRLVLEFPELKSVMSKSPRPARVQTKGSSFSSLEDVGADKGMERYIREAEIDVKAICEKYSITTEIRGRTLTMQSTEESLKRFEKVREIAEKLTKDPKIKLLEAERVKLEKIVETRRRR